MFMGDLRLLFTGKRCGGTVKGLPSCVGDTESDDDETYDG
jgi:hypothetical protein